MVWLLLSILAFSAGAPEFGPWALGAWVCLSALRA